MVGRIFDGKRKIELLCGLSLSKSTPAREAEEKRQPSNVSGFVATQGACYQILSQPSARTETTKDVHL
jgi:hypothetical protein